MKVTLPQAVGDWTLSGPTNRIQPSAIFNYMDGAGELYLGYRFKFLDVYEYKNVHENDLLVELYWMDSSDDAFGLLSNDWGGNPVDLTSSPGRPGGSSGARALYGAGLLRIWSGDLYARVMAYEESEASKQAVLMLGKVITEGRPESMAPHLIRALPHVVGLQFTLREDRSVYLRSHLVFNSAYFLSAENLLNLGPDCEMAAAVYRQTAGVNSQKQVHVLLVRYPSEALARAALIHFQGVYLSGKSLAAGKSGVVPIEDGWAGFILSGRGLGLVFEAPDEPSTRLLIESSKQALDEVEESHD